MLIAFCALSALSAGRAAAEGCALERASTIPIHFSADDRLLADATIDGRKATLLVAPDVAYTAFTPAATRSYGLPLSGQRRESIFYHGVKLETLARVARVSVGGTAIEDAFLPVLPDSVAGDDPAGIVGGDFLGRYDIEIDPAGGAINLFKPNTCAASPVYWAKAWFELPIRVDSKRRVDATITLDGKPVDAAIDLAATRSVLSPEAASGLFGVAAGEPTHRFASLTLGGITLHNVEAAIGPAAAADAIPGSSGAPQFRLGMHELRKLRFFLDYETGKMLFTIASAH
jgi:hypothetical protein